MQARFDFFGKEFSFKDIDKKAFDQHTKEGKINLEILRNAYLAKQEDLEVIEGDDIASFFNKLLIKKMIKKKLMIKMN